MLHRLRPLIIVKVCALLAVLGACTPEVHHGPLVKVEPPSSAMVFRGASVFDSRTGAFLGPRDVWVVEKRIFAVTDPGVSPPGAPSGPRDVDVSGQFLLPGLVDAHVHILGNGSPPWAKVEVAPEENLESYLRAGITTVFDLGGFGKDNEALAVRVEKGELLAPRIFHTHLHITGEGAHPVPLAKALSPWWLGPVIGFVVPQVASPEEAPAAVDDALAAHADYIKVVYDQLPESAPLMRKDILEALVKAAHDRGKKVVAHIGTAENAITAAEAGVDLLAHGIYRGGVTDDDAARLAKTGTPVIFTLNTWRSVAALGRNAWEPTELDRALVAKEQYAEVNRPPDSGGLFGEVVAQTHRDEGQWADNVKKLHAAGVPLWVGTDSSLIGVYPGSSYHRELAALSAAGVPNQDLLVAATRLPAEWIGGDFGVVEAGAPADLLVVRDDPLADLGALATPSFIVAAGRVVTPLE